MNASEAKNVIEAEDLRTEHGIPLGWSITATPGGFVAESPVQAGGKVVRIYNASGQKIGELGVTVEPVSDTPRREPVARPEPPRTEPPQPDWIDAADVAKLVRTRLKADFPGVKFSVRTSKYSMGASITVYWTDGPTTKQVDAAVAQYGGSGFDGSIDLKYSWSSWLLPDGTAQVAHSPGTTGSMGGDKPVDTAKPHADARLVHFGADYVFTSRSLAGNLEARRVMGGCLGGSDTELRERVGRDLCELQGVEYDGLHTRHLLGAGDCNDLSHHVGRLLYDTAFPPGQQYAGVAFSDEHGPDGWVQVKLAPAKD